MTILIYLVIYSQGKFPFLGSILITPDRIALFSGNRIEVATSGAIDETYQGAVNWLSMASAITRYPASLGCKLGPKGLGAHIHVSSHA